MIRASLAGPLAQFYSQKRTACDLLDEARALLVAVVFSGRDGLRAVPSLISGSKVDGGESTR